MKITCRQCSANFEITQDDLEFYEKVSPIFEGKRYDIPPPTLCPPCRQQRRLAFRNERKLYHRKCDLSGKQMISFYSPDKPYTVYHPEEWWSDKWDGTKYGQEFDVNQPFFKQFQELVRSTPKLAMMIMHSENADYAPYTIHYKNCYMCVSGYEGEDNYYGFFLNQCKDCVDCSLLNRSELCYDCTCCESIYNCIKCFDCEHVSDSLFCFDCKNCKNCIGCTGLRGKQYCVLNEQLTKEEYEEKEQELKTHLAYAFEHFYPKVLQKKLEQPHLSAILTNSENCTGHFIYNSKNAVECFECTDLEDCKYCSNVLYTKDAYDCYYFPKCELMYEIMSSNNSSRESFCYTCWDSHNLLYCFECMNCKNCFGCSDLNRKEYCILNKQYTKEEYEALVPKIIEHMQTTGEWGEYFPIALSPFGYNESIAQDYFEVSQKEAKEHGWNWHEEEVSGQYFGPEVEPPDQIENTTDDICKNILRCVVTQKPYKVIPQELSFYRRMQLPVPRKCPEQRFKERMALRNPRKLWSRSCDKCNKDIQTTYAPDRPETVYCETCYLSTIS